MRCSKSENLIMFLNIVCLSAISTALALCNKLLPQKVDYLQGRSKPSKYQI